jgi:hypothetical protein
MKKDEEKRFSLKDLKAKGWKVQDVANEGTTLIKKFWRFGPVHKIVWDKMSRRIIVDLKQYKHPVSRFFYLYFPRKIKRKSY